MTLAGLGFALVFGFGIWANFAAARSESGLSFTTERVAVVIELIIFIACSLVAASLAVTRSLIGALLIWAPIGYSWLGWSLALEGGVPIGRGVLLAALTALAGRGALAILEFRDFEKEFGRFPDAWGPEPEDEDAPPPAASA